MAAARPTEIAPRILRKTDCFQRISVLFKDCRMMFKIFRNLKHYRYQEKEKNAACHNSIQMQEAHSLLNRRQISKHLSDVADIGT